MCTLLASLDERVKLVGVFGKIESLEDHELVTTNNDRGFAFDRCIGQLTEFALRLADSARLHNGPNLVCIWIEINYRDGAIPRNAKGIDPALIGPSPAGSPQLSAAPPL